MAVWVDSKELLPVRFNGSLGGMAVWRLPTPSTVGPFTGGVGYSPDRLGLFSLRVNEVR